MICARPGCGLIFCDDNADGYPPGPQEATPRRYCSATCKKRDKPSYRRGQQSYQARRLLAVCAKQGKQAYPDEAAALRMAARLARDPALYPYECAGHWHLTSRPPAPPENQPQNSSAFTRVVAAGRKPAR